MVSFLEEKVKEPRGIRGKPTMTLQQHFVPLVTTPESVKSFIKQLWVRVSDIAVRSRQ